MVDLSKYEEDYLKALFHLSIERGTVAGTNDIAEFLAVSPASVNGMLKKLKAKMLVKHERYAKPSLTKKGRAIAVNLIRKHRLWETFLYEKMNFTWDEVHDVAEQLEHVRSDKLVLELAKFLGNPKLDPHGDVIPDADGNYQPVRKLTLAEMDIGEECKLVGVKDGSVAFLKFVTKIGLELSSAIRVADKLIFDGSFEIAFDGKQVTVSKKFAENVFVVRTGEDA